VGILGDLSLDPVGPLMSEQARVFSFGIRAADVLDKRGNYSTSLDSILYGSADSYEQMKLIYLQARRFELDGTQEDDYFDPYEEIFNEN
ncbi:MAG: MlaA family lipoprotein, partial [Paracoccaceae bacterium]